jgi:hypothetical protein
MPSQTVGSLWLMCNLLFVRFSNRPMCDLTGGPADQCPQLGVERTQRGRRLGPFMTQLRHELD